MSTTTTSRAIRDYDYILQTAAASTAITSPDGYRIGHVKTPQGVVAFYMQWAGPPPHDTAKRYTQLNFCWQGRAYVRQIERTFTDMGLARVAHRFAKEVVG